MVAASMSCCIDSQAESKNLVFAHSALGYHETVEGAILESIALHEKYVKAEQAGVRRLGEFLRECRKENTDG